MGWWWTLWIINSIIGQIIFHYPSEAVNDLIGKTVVVMISNAIGIPLSLITVKVINDYSNVEPLLKKTNDEE